MSKQKKRKIKLIDAKYQPSKAELEEDLRSKTPGEVTLDEFERMAAQLVRPVDVEWKKKP